MLPESARWLAVTGQSELSLEYLNEVAHKNKKNVNSEVLMEVVKSCCEVKKGKEKKSKRMVTFSIAPIETPEEVPNACLRSFIKKVWTPIKGGLSIYLSLLETPEMRKRTLLIWAMFITVDLVYYGVVFDSATLTNDPYLLVFLG